MSTSNCKRPNTRQHPLSFLTTPNPRSVNVASVVDGVLKGRYSARYYLPTPIDKATIEAIVDAASNAPSGNNMQPWKVYAISGLIKATISNEMVKAHNNHEPYEARYAYYPPILPSEYQVRKFNFGKFWYGHLGIDHDDFAAREASNTRNYEFFDAPVALIFTMHSEMRQGSWMDLGHFMQSITIAARARGLESVTQLSVPKFDEIIRKHLPIPEEYLVAASISLGHPDLEKVAKYYKRPVKMELRDVLEVYGM
ncbi:Nitroreductase [Favolaschia claudopus]|uniref:Nitroreductase n=1 Tax=Favolaschia claudopus TaxID=2862362 RepID=A0AAW0AV74_9AGAR